MESEATFNWLSGRKVCKGGSWLKENGGDNGWHLARGFYWQKEEGMWQPPPQPLTKLIGSMLSHRHKVEPGKKVWAVCLHWGKFCPPQPGHLAISEDVFGCLIWGLESVRKLLAQDSPQHMKNYLPQMSRMPRSRTPSLGGQVCLSLSQLLGVEIRGE